MIKKASRRSGLGYENQGVNEVASKKLTKKDFLGDNLNKGNRFKDNKDMNKNK